jgi:hypothetical protein
MRGRIAPTLACILLLSAAAGAEDASPDEPSPADGFASFSVSECWRGDVLPSGLLYPLYLADPYRPTISASRHWMLDSGIPGAGDARYLFRFGARLGLLRFTPEDDSRAGLQIDAEGGWLGLFDLDSRQDSIGWEGLYGVYLTAATGGGLAAQIGLKHESSHVGDEYIDTNDYELVGYTRQELILGVSYSAVGLATVYGECGYAYSTLNAGLQEPLRLQAGFQLERPDLLLDGKAGLYAAVDLKSYQESNWSIDTTVQAGFVFPGPGRAPTWRVGFEYRNGRSIIGEFHEYDESYLAFGIWVDL